jgi:ATP-dependent Clp protease ATP-binding subunit ClpX
MNIVKKSLIEMETMAENKGVGARGLRSIIEKIMLPLQYRLPAEENIEKYITCELL